jgi:hypothetical protein
MGVGRNLPKLGIGNGGSAWQKGIAIAQLLQFPAGHESYKHVQVPLLDKVVGLGPFASSGGPAAAASAGT